MSEPSDSLCTTRLDTNSEHLLDFRRNRWRTFYFQTGAGIAGCVLAEEALRYQDEADCSLFFVCCGRGQSSEHG